MIITKLITKSDISTSQRLFIILFLFITDQSETSLLVAFALFVRLLLILFIYCLSNAAIAAIGHTLFSFSPFFSDVRCPLSVVRCPMSRAVPPQAARLWTSARLRHGAECRVPTTHHRNIYLL